MRLHHLNGRLQPLATRRVAVAALLVVFATMAMMVASIVMTALDRVATYANHLDEERSRETLVGAIQTFEHQLGATLLDYTAWDDAAANAYDNQDMAWMISNFGDMTFDSDLFDVAIVLNAQGEPMMAYADGQPIDGGIKGYLTPALMELFEKVRTGQTGPVPQALGFVRTQKGIGSAGVALIRPKSGDIGKPQDAFVYLSFIRHLSSSTVERISEAYVLPGLALIPPSSSKTSVTISAPSGEPVASLAWTPRAPGDQSREQVKPLITAAVVIIVIYCLLLAVIGNAEMRRVRADEANAVKLAQSDRLSGLLNRAGLNQFLEDAVQRGREVGEDVVLLYLDLDGFKEVNDAYGHATGDRLIRAVGAGLSVLVDEKAGLARIGGDEFGIVLTGKDAQVRASHLAESILAFFDEPVLLGERTVVVGCSIGVCVSEGGSVDGGELTRRADMAMYSSKDCGRGRSTVYDPRMDEERETRNQMEIDLRGAIARSEIEVVYQPVVDAKTFALVSVEALARWTRKGHGPVSPDVFIPIAETSGLIDRLGLCVLRQSLQQLSHWPELKLSVNVSPGQFRDPSFVDHVAAMFEETNIDADRVVLEMTETYFIQSPDRARLAMERLRALGLRIALDDFGAGFSSVGYLRQFGFDRMKIDRSLVQSLDRGHRAVEMLQATVALARSLGIPVTAEGVETEQQAVILRLSGCDQLQGYLFGRPQSPDEIGALMLRPMELRAKAAELAFAGSRDGAMPI